MDRQTFIKLLIVSYLVQSGDKTLFNSRECARQPERVNPVGIQRPYMALLELLVFEAPSSASHNAANAATARAEVKITSRLGDKRTAQYTHLRMAVLNCSQKMLSPPHKT